MEYERVFSVAGIMTGLRCIRLAIENCSNLILINKNYPNEDAGKTRDFLKDEEDHLIDYEKYLESFKNETEDSVVSEIIQANAFD